MHFLMVFRKRLYVEQPQGFVIEKKEEKIYRLLKV